MPFTSNSLRFTVLTDRPISLELHSLLRQRLIIYYIISLIDYFVRGLHTTKLENMPPKAARPPKKGTKKAAEAKEKVRGNTIQCQGIFV